MKHSMWILRSCFPNIMSSHNCIHQWHGMETVDRVFPAKRYELYIRKLFKWFCSVALRPTCPRPEAVLRWMWTAISGRSPFADPSKRRQHSQHGIYAYVRRTFVTPSSPPLQPRRSEVLADESNEFRRHCCTSAFGRKWFNDGRGLKLCKERT